MFSFFKKQDTRTLAERIAADTGREITKSAQPGVFSSEIHAVRFSRSSEAVFDFDAIEALHAARAVAKHEIAVMEIGLEVWFEALVARNFAA